MTVIMPKVSSWIPKPRNANPIEWIDAGTWSGKTPPRREWLVEGMIPMRTVTLLSGDGGIGKSLLAQQLMTSCALGRDFIGFNTIRCNTLGLFCEDEPQELQRRQRGICAGYQIDESDLDGLVLASRTGQDNILMDFDRKTDEWKITPLFEQVRGKAKAMGAQLVIIDTAADTFGGNENIRPQVRAYIQSLASLARAIDGAVVLTAHPSAAGLASGSGYSGNTAWNNTVRSRLYFSRPKENPDDAEPTDTDARVLKFMKSNYGKLNDDLKLRYDQGAFVPLVSNAKVVDSAIDRADLKRLALNAVRTLCGRGAYMSMLKKSRLWAVGMVWDTPNCRDFSPRDVNAALQAMIESGELVEAEVHTKNGVKVAIRPADWKFPEER